MEMKIKVIQRMEEHKNNKWMGQKQKINNCLVKIMFKMDNFLAV
jgi:hypothetical protein